MHNFARVLIAMLPLSIASPYSVIPRGTTGCTSASFGNFSWTIEAFTYSSSEAFSAPSREVALGSVDFNLYNPVLPETVHCAASTTAITAFLYGDLDYACTVPEGSKTKTSFTFDRTTNELGIKQIWTCNDREHPIIFTGYGAVNLTLNCEVADYPTTGYTSPDSGLHSNRATSCAPVTFSLTPVYKAAVA